MQVALARLAGRRRWPLVAVGVTAAGLTLWLAISAPWTDSTPERSASDAVVHVPPSETSSSEMEAPEKTGVVPSTDVSADVGFEIHFQRSDQRGSFQVLTADALPLYTGDRVQIHARLSRPMAAYVVALSADGSMALIYDSTETAAGLVAEVAIPPGRDDWLPLEPPGGTETLILLARPAPLDDPQKILDQLRACGPPPAFSELALLWADESGPQLQKASASVVLSRGLGWTPVRAEKGFLDELTRRSSDVWPVVRAVSFPHWSSPASPEE